MRKLSKITESIWSDMQDRSAGDVVRKEDQWKIDLIKEFIERHHLKENDYHINADCSLDIHRNIMIKPVDILDVKEGKLPFKFGRVDGTMWLNGLGLKTLENCPSEVTGDFVIYENKLENFIGGPENVGGDFAANMNLSLKSLDGSPKKVGGKYSILACMSIKDISGISPEIGGNLEIPKKTKFEFSDDDFRQYSNIKGEIKRL